MELRQFKTMKDIQRYFQRFSNIPNSLWLWFKSWSYAFYLASAYIKGYKTELPRSCYINNTTDLIVAQLQMLRSYLGSLWHLKPSSPSLPQIPPSNFLVHLSRRFAKYSYAPKLFHKVIPCSLSCPGASHRHCHNLGRTGRGIRVEVSLPCQGNK